MRILFATLALCLCAFLISGSNAGEKGKEVKLEGKICCAKCELGVGDACATVIVVTKDKKDVVYYFDKASHKEHHDTICSTAMKGSVVGVVSKVGDKNIVAAKKVEFKK